MAMTPLLTPAQQAAVCDIEASVKKAESQQQRYVGDLFSTQTLRHLLAALTALTERVDCGGTNCGACQQCLRVALHFATARLAAVEGERDEAKYVPGVSRCAKCGFVKEHVVLNVATSQVGAPIGASKEDCPNGCGPLWRVSWVEHCQAMAGDRDAALARERGLRLQRDRLHRFLAGAVSFIEAVNGSRDCPYFMDVSRHRAALGLTDGGWDG